MIYFVRVINKSIQIAACETEEKATTIEARGFTRCTPEVYRAAWQEKDEKACAELRMQAVEAVIAASRARIVGRLPGKVYPPFETGL